MPKAKTEDRVDNTALREATLARSAEGLTYSEIARRCDWFMKGGTAPNPTMVRRRLGIERTVSIHKGKRYYSCNRTIAYDDAVKIARAINVYPVDVGL